MGNLCNAPNSRVSGDKKYKPVKEEAKPAKSPSLLDVDDKDDSRYSFVNENDISAYNPKYN